MQAVRTKLLFFPELVIFRAQYKRKDFVLIGAMCCAMALRLYRMNLSICPRFLFSASFPSSGGGESTAHAKPAVAALLPAELRYWRVRGAVGITIFSEADSSDVTGAVGKRPDFIINGVYATLFPERAQHGQWYEVPAATICNSAGSVPRSMVRKRHCRVRSIAGRYHHRVVLTIPLYLILLLLSILNIAPLLFSCYNTSDVRQIPLTSRTSVPPGNAARASHEQCTGHLGRYSRLYRLLHPAGAHTGHHRHL